MALGSRVFYLESAFNHYYTEADIVSVLTSQISITATVGSADDTAISVLVFTVSAEVIEVIYKRKRATGRQSIDELIVFHANRATKETIRLHLGVRD